EVATRVPLLARVSKDTSGRDHSIDEQLVELHAWAQREGWSVVQVIHDVGNASEFSEGTSRREWDKTLDWVRSGRIDALLTWESSRATRPLDSYSELRDMCRTHAVLYGYDGTTYDPRRPVPHNLRRRSRRGRSRPHERENQTPSQS